MMSVLISRSEIIYLAKKILIHRHKSDWRITLRLMGIMVIWNLNENELQSLIKWISRIFDWNNGCVQMICKPIKVIAPVFEQAPINDYCIRVTMIDNAFQMNSHSELPNLDRLFKIYLNVYPTIQYLCCVQTNWEMKIVLN